MGWAEGFEPSTTGTTIRRSTKLSYAHREDPLQSNKRAHVRQCSLHRRLNAGTYSPACFHSRSTRALTSGDISISPGHGRVKPSVGHFRVASTPILEP